MSQTTLQALAFSPRRGWHWLAILLVMLAAAWLRWHLLDVPLERDEGEYAYGGQLLLQGVPPYQLLYNMKLPGMYAIYAAIITLCGQSAGGIHLGLLGVNAATILIVFLLGCRLATPLAGLIAGASFALLSAGQSVQGVFANAEHFVLLPVLTGLLLLLIALKTRRPGQLLLSGILLGTGIVIKQHAILFAGGAVLLLAQDCWRQRGHLGDKVGQMALLIGGIVLPYGLTCLLLVKAGVFLEFWFWTMDYARAYTGQVSWLEAWRNLREQGGDIAAASPLIWLAAALGLGLCCKRSTTVPRPFLLVGFSLISFLAVCPGLFFRPHYFVLLLPAAALLTGIAGQTTISRMLGNRGRGSAILEAMATLAILTLCLGEALYHQHQFLLQFTPSQASRDTYWPNPFNESAEIARYLRENSQPTDTIAILGSEPQIFFYANRRSATGYIYMYPLMEDQPFAPEMQQRLIAEVEQAGPEYLLFVRVPTSWLQRPNSTTSIYDWFTHYKEGYQRVGMVEIFDSSSRISWLPEDHWPPTTPYWIEILRKRHS